MSVIPSRLKSVAGAHVQSSPGGPGISGPRSKGSVPRISHTVIRFRGGSNHTMSVIPSALRSPSPPRTIQSGPGGPAIIRPCSAIRVPLISETPTVFAAWSRQSTSCMPSPLKSPVGGNLHPASGGPSSGSLTGASAAAARPTSSRTTLRSEHADAASIDRA